MQSTASLLDKIKSDYPQLNFKKGTQYMWSPSENTIFFADSIIQPVSLLHELAHATLDHHNYHSDIQLIALEKQAWVRTKELATKYDIKISDKIIEANLDSYRDWLHSRSLCPKCNANGLQISSGQYQCPECDGVWRVNEARSCKLKRYVVNN